MTHETKPLRAGSIDEPDRETQAEQADIAALGQAHEGPSAAPLPGWARIRVAVWWPAFLIAGITEMGVFAFVDPHDLHWLSGAALGAPRSAVYTLAFFAFWLLIGLSGSLTQLLLSSPAPDGRPG